MGKGKGLLPESTLRANIRNCNRRKTQQLDLSFFFNVKSISVYSHLDDIEPELEIITSTAVAPVILASAAPAVEPIAPVSTPIIATPTNADLEDNTFEEDFTPEYFPEDNDFYYDEYDFMEDDWSNTLSNKKRGGVVQRSKREDRDRCTMNNRKSEIRIMRSNGSCYISAAASRKENARASEASVLFALAVSTRLLISHVIIDCSRHQYARH